jgi:hypothetical protein
VPNGCPDAKPCGKDTAGFCCCHAATVTRCP